MARLHHTPGDPLPGDWQDNPDGPRTWKGPCMWTTTHGPAECDWLFAKPHAGRNVLLPDGSRGAVEARMRTLVDGDAPDSWRRREGNAWMRGRVEWREDDGVFIDAPAVEGTAPSRESADPSMEADMMDSDHIRRLVRDEEFALALYAAMCNVIWRKIIDPDAGAQWSCSWRHAGGVVADLRNMGEDYTDFYCGGQEGRVHEDVAAALRALGWRPKTEDETRADHLSALADIADWEQRPASERPEWYTVTDTVPVDDAVVPKRTTDRIHRLGRTGRVTSEEYRTLWHRIDIDYD